MGGLYDAATLRAPVPFARTSLARLQSRQVRDFIGVALGAPARLLEQHARWHPENHKCRDPGSNRGPSDLQSDALPTELSRLLSLRGVGQRQSFLEALFLWPAAPGPGPRRASRNCAFKSRAPLASWTRRRTSNPKIAGSSPAGGACMAGLRHCCKPVAFAMRLGQRIFASHGAPPEFSASLPAGLGGRWPCEVQRGAHL